MSTTTAAELLVQQFRNDFGFDTPPTIDVGPITVKDRKYTFTMCPVKGHADQSWVATHSKVYVPATVEGAYSAEIATNMEISLATVALSTRAINDIPLWLFMETAGLLKLTEEMKAGITDPLWPPDGIHKEAANVFAAMLSSGHGFDRNLITYLFDRHNQEFEATADFPELERVVNDYPFKCGECHYIVTLDGDEVDAMREHLEEHGTVFCPKCGNEAHPPEGEGMEDEASPLRTRFGRQ